MALVIEPLSSPTAPDDALHVYRVTINGEHLATFQHVRSHGAVELLRLAADELEAQQPDLKFSNPKLARSLMKAQRNRLKTNQESSNETDAGD